ncbi:MAG: 3-hydroxyacyl-ACP dehydratase FabZ [Oleibacter sp.]|nr:3-hydroxyacyl-ACP dehydratase FabZ [Thalassolituus sp.]
MSTDHALHKIKDIMPHRYPFLFLDRIIEIDMKNADGPFVKALKNVTNNEDFFNGHFPGHPIMPGVLILEALAQAAGYLGVIMQGDKWTDKSIFYFAGVEHVRFKRPVTPGDQIMLEANLLTNRRGVWKFNCVATVAGEKVCCAEVSLINKTLE